MGKFGGSVADLCPVDGCSEPVKKMHFCKEHFVWFKEGLVNKKGERPTDFDKKYQHYLRRTGT